MKKRIENIFLAGICMLVLSACGSKEGKLKISDESLFVGNQNDKGLSVSDSVNKDTMNMTKVNETAISPDTTNDNLDAPPYSTATLLNAKEYFRTNNKYKNWDPKNSKTVLIKAIVEKDGSTTNVKVMKECDEDILNKEAVRLIRDAKANGAHIDPAKNEDGNPVRSKWAIPVYFPPA